MKNISRRAISVLALTAILVLAAVQIPASGQNRARRIEGTWRVQVTPGSCQGVPGPVSFPGKNTFIPGGSFIATGSTTTPFLLSTGQGVWEHLGGRDFVAVYEFFAYTQDHVFVGTQKVTQNIELDPVDQDRFTSTNSFETIGPNGNVIGSGCATLVAQRME
jgi:hypothetical protein